MLDWINEVLQYNIWNNDFSVLLKSLIQVLLLSRQRATILAGNAHPSEK